MKRSVSKTPQHPVCSPRKWNVLSADAVGCFPRMLFVRPALLFVLHPRSNSWICISKSPLGSLDAPKFSLSGVSIDIVGVSSYIVLLDVTPALLKAMNYRKIFDIVGKPL